ncbi:radical SAM protein [bacterium]|nr:radical SAM protein [bacterium]
MAESRPTDDRPAIVLLNPPGTRRYLRDCYCSSVDKAGYYWQPLDLLLQAAHLARDFRVVLVDAIVTRLAPAACLELIARERPVAILSLCSHLSWPEDRPFFQALATHVDAPLYLSGDLPRFQSRAVMDDAPFVDGVLMDITAPCLADRLRTGAHAERTSITHRRGGEIVAGELVGRKWFSHPIPPHDMFFEKGYRFPLGLAEPVASVLTMHGCPYQCDYCNTGMIHFSRREPDNLEAELDHLHACGIRSLKICDATFNHHPTHVRAFCEMLIEKRYGFRWFCYARADTLDDAQIALMARAGCRFVAFGLESGSEAILADHKEGAGLPATFTALEACRRHGIETLGHFVIGLTGETSDTLETTRRFLRTVPLDYASFNLFDPRPGARLLGETVTPEKALRGATPNDDADRTDSHANGVSLAELRAWQSVFYRAFYWRPRYLLRRITRIRDARVLARYLRQGLRVLRAGLRASET